MKEGKKRNFGQNKGGENIHRAPSTVENNLFDVENTLFGFSGREKRLWMDSNGLTQESAVLASPEKTGSDLKQQTDSTDSGMGSKDTDSKDTDSGIPAVDPEYRNRVISAIQDYHQKHRKKGSKSKYGIRKTKIVV